MVGIDANLASSLLGGASTNINPNVRDVITGKASGGLTSAISASLSDALGSTTNLTSGQTSSFSNLAEYIVQNVNDNEAKAKLLNDLSALQSILETGNTSANQDPVFSLLAGLSEYNEGSSSPSGLIVDSLL